MDSDPSKIMLSSFFIKNFRSILELKLDFSYGEGKAPNGYQEQEILPFLEARNKCRLVPCMAFFGANASGKTNLLKALFVFKRLVFNGSKLAKLFDPNLLNPKFSDTTFSIEFIIDEECFNYSVTYDATEILEETLERNGNPLYAINRLKANFSRQIISSTYSEDKLSDILRVECSDGEGRQTKPFLNRIGRNYPGLDSDLKNVFGFFAGSLNAWINSENILLPFGVKILAQALNGDEKAALLEITDVVRRLDIDIAAIDIVQKELLPDEDEPTGFMTINRDTGAKHAWEITATHKDAEGKPVQFDFLRQESAGTQRLAGLVGLVLHALKTGSVLLVDELESSLHPLLMREILMLFKTRTSNPKGAQLIITTHNTDILDDSILRLSEIALVKKTLANGTLVRRLVDYKTEGKDIRNVTKFRKQYLAGYYSGIPHPAL
jgi:AAA15 family ATPase/GTPase